MFNKVSRYWWCQIVGWSVNVAISVFFVSTFGKPGQKYFISLLLTCVLGLIITHIMRLNIFFLKVLEKPLKTQITYFVILTIIFAILLGVTSESVDFLIGYNPERLQKFS